jgi:hypothetical protein
MIALRSIVLLLLAAPLLTANDVVLSPGPMSEKNRLLGMVSAANYNHIDPLKFILNEYVAMCESGFEVTIALISHMTWSKSMKEIVYTNTFCYRTGTTIPMQYVVMSDSERQDATLKHSLHRKFAKENVNNYDVFLYHEDDTIFTFPHVMAYLRESHQLNTLLAGDNGSNVPFIDDYGIGFVRMRRQLRYGNIHAGNFGAKQIIEVSNHMRSNIRFEINFYSSH